MALQVPASAKAGIRRPLNSPADVQVGGRESGRPRGSRALGRRHPEVARSEAPGAAWNQARLNNPRGRPG